ncbi:MAG: M23 family metallopeptidase [Mariprofundaceae bacterium]|nr:M23 family metallopeptidase [Mariprofundaceae bacterium]
MSHFSLMVVSDTGPIKRFSVRKLWLRCAVFSLVLLLALAVFGGYSFQQQALIQTALDQSRYQLRLQKQKSALQHQRLQAMLDTERNKMMVYARSLGKLQAKLVRLDSLGERLVDVAKLDKDEFDFSTDPAIGGVQISLPMAASNIRFTLDEEVKDTLSRLSHLDTQLAVIDMVLQDSRELSLARPHAWPTEGGSLSSHFGRRNDPFTGRPGFHKGVDIANRYGAAVLSSSRGVVVYAGRHRDYGYMVEIEHGYGYRTRYAHLSSIVVKAGDEVKDAQIVGRIGSSGRSTGPHLHFEVYRFGKLLNPAKFIPRS